MEFVSPQCANQSIGPANQFFGLLVQTILTAHCTISPPGLWPRDYGANALETGRSIYDVINNCLNS